MSKVKKEEVLENAIAAIKEAKKYISYSIQFSEAVHDGRIKPEVFKKNLTILDDQKNPIYINNYDWTKSKEEFEQETKNIQIIVSNFVLMVCSENFLKILEQIREDEEKELFHAIKIIKLFRNNPGHFEFMDLKEKKEICTCWRIDKEKDRRIFEVKSIGIKLDARNLHGKKFDISYFGGFGSIINVLNFIEERLNEKLRQKLLILITLIIKNICQDKI